jgi:hypothetical protein
MTHSSLLFDWVTILRDRVVLVHTAVSMCVALALFCAAQINLQIDVDWWLRAVIVVGTIAELM